MKSGLKKAIAITSATLVGMTGLIGVLHMPFGKSLLMKLGGCPIVRMSPEQLEQAQNAGMANVAANASGTAPVRPALGFVLEKTTPDEVHAWIASKGINCKDDLNGTVILCTNVPAATIGEQGPDMASLSFGFRASPEVLRNVSTFRNHMSREQAVRIIHDRGDELTRQLGAPDVKGQPELLSPTSNAYLVTFNFKDYLAKEAAAEVGSGFTLSENFVSQVAVAQPTSAN